MATFGFYFGYTFGLIRLALVLFSFLFATVAAMSFTPTTSSIIRETFGVESVFLPFIAFGVTLLVVLMLARIVTKLIEETLTSERFEVLSRIIGGGLMALLFTLLYSVLVIFFGKSGVLPLIFNEEITITPKDGTLQLGIPPKPIASIGRSDTLLLALSSDSMHVFSSKEGSVGLKLGILPLAKETYQAYVNNKGRSWTIAVGDTIFINGTRQLVVQDQKAVRCFCDSAFLAYAEKSSLVVRCTDPIFSAKSATSIFYPYIEIIPKTGNQLMNGLRPLIYDFVEYMEVALDRVERQPKPNTVIDTYDGTENRPSVEPQLEDPLPPALDSIPVVTPSTTIDTTADEATERPATNDEG